MTESAINEIDQEMQQLLKKRNVLLERLEKEKEISLKDINDEIQHKQNQIKQNNEIIQNLKSDLDKICQSIKNMDEKNKKHTSDIETLEAKKCPLLGYHKAVTDERGEYYCGICGEYQGYEYYK